MCVRVRVCARVQAYLNELGALLLDAHMLVLVQRLELLVSERIERVLDIGRVHLEFGILDRRHGDLVVCWKECFIACENGQRLWVLVVEVEAEAASVLLLLLCEVGALLLGLLDAGSGLQLGRLFIAIWSAS